MSFTPPNLPFPERWQPVTWALEYDTKLLKKKTKHAGKSPKHASYGASNLDPRRYHGFGPASTQLVFNASGIYNLAMAVESVPWFHLLCWRTDRK